MILTITMNPSIDMSYSIEKLHLNDINRVSEVSKTAGGKGLNVARVIHELEGEVTASGILGGYLGEQIKEQLNIAGISHNFYPIAQETRNSIAVLHDGGKQTEILEAGPTVTTKEIEGFLSAFEQLIDKAEWLTISGSLAQGLPIDFYTQLVEIAKRSNVDTLLDASGKALKEALKGNQKPKLIKPNLTEITDLLGSKADFEQPTAIKNTLEHPLFQGVEWIVVTLGGDGAVVKYKNQFYQARLPKIDVVNPVGSGDATLAGLAYALSHFESVEDVIKTGMTTGMLNALEPVTGHINKARFQELYNKIEVNPF